MAGKIAQFRFLDHKIVETSFKFNPSIKRGEKIELNFGQSAGVNESEHKMRDELTVHISDSNKSFDIDLKVLAIFEYDVELSEEQKQHFIRFNAQAILFPYIRAYVSSITALAGIPQVLLPTLNFSK